MRIHHDQLEVRTNGKGTYEITDAVQAKIDKRGLRNGTVTVFVQHTSCSVIIMENADPTARHDLEEFSIVWCRKMLITLLTVRKAAMTCRRTSAWY